jgi:hypothetical protein
MRTRRRFAVAVLLGLAAAGLALAGTTGKLTGKVTDSEGNLLPGVSISITSPAQIGGAKTATTEADGGFDFPLLAPGPYAVVAELDGFAPQTVQDVQVRLDGTTRLDIEMAPARVNESIVVTSEAPVVDPDQVELSTTFTQEYLENAAIGSANRAYQNVLDHAGGVVDDGGNPHVLGSTLGENAFFVDGVDTTDPVTSTFGTNFNFDAIAEISSQIGGFEAEYGRATGGIVNVVTKSGGNNFSGTLDVRYTGDSFTQSGDHFDPDEQENTSVIPGATFGGPIVQDRAWFFLAAEHDVTEFQPANTPAARKFVGDSYLGKLTWQMNSAWQAVAKYSADPAEIDNATITPGVAAEAETFQEQGGTIAQAEVTGVLSPALVVSFKGAMNRSELNSFPQTGDFDAISHLDDATGELTGSSGNAQYSNRDRDELMASATFMPDRHAIKAGVEYSALDFKSKNYTPTGYAYTDRDGAPRLLFVSDPSPPFDDSTGAMWTGYLQDSWNVTPSLVVKAGLRYDTVAYENDIGDQVADMDKLQPRLGVAWDITHDGRTLARASWGRFMHPSALTTPSFARTSQTATDRYISCSRFAELFGSSPESCQADFSPDWIADPQGGWDPFGWIFFDSFAANPSVIDPGLKPTYAEELIVTFERQILDRTSIEVSYVDKQTNDIFEDTCEGNLPTPNADAACDTFVLANLGDDVLDRNYEGIIVGFETRALSWLDIRANYTYAKSKGSVEYTQNAGSDFDFFPDHYVNRYGYLSDDRRHRVKVHGFANLAHDFTIGMSAFWSSAFAYSHTEGANVGYGLTYISPRGAFRANDNYQVDLELKKGFQIGEFRMQLIGTVFNVLDSERPTSVCTHDDCGGGFALGDPLTFQTPRNYEVGIRFEF